MAIRRLNGQLLIIQGDVLCTCVCESQAPSRTAARLIGAHTQHEDQTRVSNQLASKRLRVVIRQTCGEYDVADFLVQDGQGGAEFWYVRRNGTIILQLPEVSM